MWKVRSGRGVGRESRKEGKEREWIEIGPWLVCLSDWWILEIHFMTHYTYYYVSSTQRIIVSWPGAELDKAYKGEKEQKYAYLNWPPTLRREKPDGDCTAQGDIPDNIECLIHPSLNRIRTLDSVENSAVRLWANFGCGVIHSYVWPTPLSKISPNALKKFNTAPKSAMGANIF